MKLFVVSDVHGHADLLKKALENAKYNPDNENHLLICCGDCFDRGEQNSEVLKFFEGIDRKIMIMGNHDARLLEIMNTGMLGAHDFHNGTINTVLEFFGKRAVFDINEPIDFSGKSRMVDRLTDFINEMINYYETESYIFVHGWLPNDGKRIAADWRNADEKQWYQSRWSRWVSARYMPGNNEEKIIVCGHHPTTYGDIYREPGMIAIDAGTFSTKQVNVLVLEDELISD